MYATLDAPIHASPRALETVLALGRPTVVVFETPGCEPCQALVPTLESLAREFAEQVLIVRVEAREGWLAARHHLTFVPTLLFCDRGTEQFRIKGNPGAPAVRAHLTFLLAGEPLPDPADGPRHTLALGFGKSARVPGLRGLIAG